MMDSNAQLEFQRKECEEIKKRFAQKEFLSYKDENSDDKKKICCNCKKSKCLKLYCECFAAQKFCSECNCLNCLNLKTNEDEIKNVRKSLLSRNPHAFKPKLEYDEVFIIFIIDFDFYNNIFHL